MNRNKDRDKFAGLMAMLDENYNQQSSKMKMELYFNAFESYDIDLIERVIYQAIRSLKFFPKIAELLELIEGDKCSRSLSAWLLVLEALEQSGTYQSVKFDDPLIHFAIERMGGWLKLADFKGEDLVWAERQFRELYSLGESKVEYLEVPEHLAGFHEIHNNSKGLLSFIPKPTLYKSKNKKQIVEKEKLKIVKTP
jgi:hypothetical protein